MAICLLLLMMDTNAWRRRRRRRRSSPSCQAVNCLVSSWTSWSSCSHPCGTSGTQRRTRQQTRAASCGGSCPYSLLETRRCNRDACQHGGTPHSSTVVVPVGQDMVEGVVGKVSGLFTKLNPPKICLCFWNDENKH